MKIQQKQIVVVRLSCIKSVLVSLHKVKLGDRTANIQLDLYLVS